MPLHAYGRALKCTEKRTCNALATPADAPYRGYACELQSWYPLASVRMMSNGPSSRSRVMSPEASDASHSGCSTCEWGLRYAWLVWIAAQGYG